MKMSSHAGAVLRHDRRFILGNLAVGHGISHWYTQGFFVILAEIQLAMGLSDFQLGTIASLLRFSQGAISIPAGFLVDILKQQWGLILTSTMVLLAGACIFVGFAPGFSVLVVASVIFYMPGALWHLPAVAALSQRFPDRRGFAISIHGAGANVGNAAGPLVAGALLGVLLWRHLLFIYAVPALMVAALVWWSLRDVGRTDGEVEIEVKGKFSAQLREMAALTRSTVLMKLMGVLLLRQMGFNALLVWTPVYLRRPVEEGGLEMEPFLVGIYFALLTALGIVSAPLMGIISDRFGRKVVLVPGMLIAAILSIAVVGVGQQLILLAVVLTIMGLFTYALAQVFQATIMDMVGRGVEATALGLVQGINNLVAAFSPAFAALLVQSFDIRSVFYYVAVLMTLSPLLLMATKLPRRPSVVPVQTKGI